MFKAIIAAGWVIFAFALFMAFVKFLVDHVELMALLFVVLCVMTIVLAFEYFKTEMRP